MSDIDDNIENDIIPSDNVELINDNDNVIHDDDENLYPGEDSSYFNKRKIYIISLILCGCLIVTILIIGLTSLFAFVIHSSSTTRVFSSEPESSSSSSSSNGFYSSNSPVADIINTESSHSTDSSYIESSYSEESLNSNNDEDDLFNDLLEGKLISIEMDSNLFINRNTEISDFLNIMFNSSSTMECLSNCNYELYSEYTQVEYSVFTSGCGEHNFKLNIDINNILSGIYNYTLTASIEKSNLFDSLSVPLDSAPRYESQTIQRIYSVNSTCNNDPKYLRTSSILELSDITLNTCSDILSYYPFLVYSNSSPLSKSSNTFIWNAKNLFTIQINESEYPAISLFTLEYDSYQEAQLGIISPPSSVIWTFSIINENSSSFFGDNIYTTIEELLLFLEPYSICY